MNVLKPLFEDVPYDLPFRGLFENQFVNYQAKMYAIIRLQKPNLPADILVPYRTYSTEVFYSCI